MPIMRECANCGAALSIPPSRAAKTARSFCDRTCMLQHRERTGFYDGENNANWRGGLARRECLQCGGLFEVKRKEIRAGRGKFCSRPCACRHRSEQALGYDPERRIQKECVVCAALFWVKQSHADRSGTYCSRDCMSADYRDRLQGEGNPHYKHGRAHTPEWQNEWSRNWRKNNPEKVRHSNRRTRAIRKQVEGRHSHKDILSLMHQQRGVCVYCQADLDDGYHVDHIIPVARGGTDYVGNLQLLCPPCNLSKSDKLPVEFRLYRGDYG